MSVFTLEVAGRPVACIHARTPEEARQTLDDPWFRDGLLAVSGDNPPVWRGDGELTIRDANVEELALVRVSCFVSMAGAPIRPRSTGSSWRAGSSIRRRSIAPASRSATLTISRSIVGPVRLSTR
jgi:hypothetical protein